MAAEEVCTLEACYVAAFRMKHRGLLLHDKLDKAAVRLHIRHRRLHIGSAGAGSVGSMPCAPQRCCCWEA